LEEVVPFLGFSHPKGTPEGHNPFTLFPTVTNQALFRPAATKKFRKFYFERTSPSHVTIQNLVFSPLPIEKDAPI